MSANDLPLRTDQFWSLMDDASEALVIIEEQGTVEYANAAALDMFGYARGELLGQPIELLVPPEIRASHVELRNGYLAAPTPRSLGSRAELFAVHKSGRRVPVRIGLSHTRTGDRIHVLAIVIDVSDRRAAEASLAQTTDELHAMFHALPDTSFRLDRRGAIVACHYRGDQCAFGTADELKGLPFEAILPEGAHPAFTAAMESVLGRSERARFEFVIEEGRKRKSQEARLVPLGAQEALVLVRDISTRKQAEAMLIQAAKLAAIGEIAGNVAHEINNPIAIISAKARLLLSDPRQELPAKVEKELTKIVEQCDRIGLLTRSLLDFSRPPASVDRVPTNVNAPLEKALDMILGRAGKSQVTVERELAATLPTVEANANELQQVFLNLLINAADAMPEGGTIWARTGRGEPTDEGRATVVIEVQDTGYGIEPEVVTRIFEPFFTTKGEVKGTGLGLAICRGIVASHDGVIDVVSTPGEGTTFTVRFPAWRP